MVFCGQCGLQIPPGETMCPRCGTVSEAASDSNAEALQADTPTVASLHYAQHPQSNVYPNVSPIPIPFAPPDVKKLILPSGSGIYGYGASGGNEPTSAMNVADFRTRQNTPNASQIGTMNSEYSTHPINPVQTGTIYPNGNYATPTQTYGESIPPGAAIASSYPITPAKKRGRGRVVALLICLLLVLGVASFFVLQRTHLFGGPVSPVVVTKKSSTNNGGISKTTNRTTPTPVSVTPEQARTLVEQYYTDVNNKDYVGAYNLWKWGSNAPTLAEFEQGYANTEHDNLIIKNATQLSDGTVKVLLTLVTTERFKGKAKHHTYVGYYIVGQDGGTLKIFQGYLNRIK